MKTTFKFLALSAALFAANTAFAQNAAVVNGKPISSALIDFVVAQQTKAQPIPEEKRAEYRKMIVERMIDFEILAQDGAKKGAGGKDLEMELGFVKTQLLARAAMKAFQDKNAVTDAEAKAEYEKQIKGVAASKEYKARHILVDDEAQAKDIIAKLKAGGKFEELAKVSKDTGSAAQGGDLGYGDPSGYVKPFADALVALKPGELTQAPVKSEFGFHVIELTDVRDAKPPAFDEVKPQLMEQLMEQKLQAYQAGLRKAATVK
jgi:peptidyl-prolyl cis-trans isomerase C